MTTIRHLHSSSRFDRTPLSLLALVKAFLGRADLITLTEVGNNTRVKALKRLPGWTFTQVEGSTPPGGDECAILTRDAALTVIASEAVQLTKLPSSVPTRRVYSADATIETVDGERALVSVVHFPAHIETGDTLGGRPIDVAAWKDSMSTWARHLEKARLKGLHIIAPADFNTNIKRAPHRERIDKLMPHLKSAWVAGGFPSRGTHGSRLIDDTRTTLDVDGVRLVNTFKSSDHVAYMATLAFPKETPVSGLCPFTTHKIIPPGSNDPVIKPRVAILHVDAGNAESLYRYFNGPSGGIESHFHIKKDGEIEQYRSIYRQADANHLANDFAVSIETQGYGAGEWTPNQLTSIKRLLTWLNANAGIPLRKCEKWDGSGIGFHVQFGAPGKWTPVSKSCPGPERISQFNRILVPWMSGALTPATPKPAAPAKPAAPKSKTPRFDEVYVQLRKARNTLEAVTTDKHALAKHRAAATAALASVKVAIKIIRRFSDKY